MIMPAVNMGDLRAEAKDSQRDKNQKAKWARGVIETPASQCVHAKHISCDTCTKHPRKSDARSVIKAAQAFHKGQVARKNTIARKVFSHEVVEAVDDNSDSSASDEVVEASAAPDAEVMYSFDSHAGPGRGSQVLSFAINQAVTRFENNETDKIVKEYDLVLDGKDELEFADAEDDFELIDVAQLK